MLRIYLCWRSYTQGMVDPRWFFIHMWRNQKIFKMWGINLRSSPVPCFILNPPVVWVLLKELRNIQTDKGLMSAKKVEETICAHLLLHALFNDMPNFWIICQIAAICSANIPLFQTLLWISGSDMGNLPMQTIEVFKPYRMVHMSSLWLNWLPSY